MNSGTSDSTRISYVAANDGNVILNTFGDTSNASAPTVGAIALGGKSYVTVNGVNQLIRVNTAGCFSALANFTGALRVVINSDYLDGSNQTCGGGVVFAAGYLYGINAGSTQYNVLSNSYLRGVSNISNGSAYTEDTITVAGDAHHNLFDGNTIEFASHVNLNLGVDKSGAQPRNNMIRNNVFNNPLHTNLQFYQSRYEVSPNVFVTGSAPDDNLAEGNRLSAGGVAVPTSPINSSVQGPGNGMEMSLARGIFRCNVIQKAGLANTNNATFSGFVLSIGGGGSLTPIENNRIYNNTIVNNLGPAVTVANWNPPATHLSNTQNKFVNNILYDSNSAVNPPATAPVMYYNDLPTDITGDQFWSNILGRPSGTASDNIANGNKWAGYQTLAQAAAQPCPSFPCFAAQFSKPNIYSASPGFVNYVGGDFHLATGTPGVDSGSALAQVTTTVAGAGTTLVVDDPYFFQDGRGIPNVQGDWIAVGTVTNIAQISNVNYSTKSITLAAAISNRTAGAKVWLYKKSDGQQVLFGAAPDIGAYESGATSCTPPVVQMGNQTVEFNADFNSAGVSEAFKVTSSSLACGSVIKLNIYVDSGSTGKLIAGLYSNSASGHPGTLLGQGTVNTPTAAAWNVVTIPAVSVTASTTYWIAILGPSGAGSGTLRFRDRVPGNCASETSSLNTLTTLQATWTTGATFTDCPLSGYATSQ